MKAVRCAIYTRKSSEEGLEQDFNSLDAQREACAAYVASQASEGWKLSPERYDDGGLSGGTLERPALLRLLEDVKSGRIDIIVVYKVDRLTRSLLDFAKLVEAFDASETSFVSVTQSFNTTTSMGRLTLNMLLSFAQFEREVTAERIRDKIAASKAKGMWMGGTPPLGYRPEGRSLEVIEDHAEIIRDIFGSYITLGNVRLVEEALIANGVRSPARQTLKAKTYGGRNFSRGQIYAILRNPIYIGEIPHKDCTYPGMHKAILDRTVWDKAQAQLADNSRGKQIVRRRNSSPLAGLLFAEDGDDLIPVHSTKGTKRYRYYVSKAHQHGKAREGSKAMRIPASEIEKLVKQELNALLESPQALLDQLGAEAQEEWYRRQQDDKHPAAPIKQSQIFALIERAVVHADRLEMELGTDAIASRLSVANAKLANTSITHIAHCRIKRSGLAMRLVDESGAYAVRSDAPAWLTGLFGKAQGWWRELAQGEIDVATLSKREGVTASYMTRVVRLAFLSPKVVEAMVNGETCAGLSSKALLAPDAVYADWSVQEEQIRPARL